MVRNKQKTIIWTSGDQDIRRHMASLDYSKLINRCLQAISGLLRIGG